MAFARLAPWSNPSSMSNCAQKPQDNPFRLDIDRKSSATQSNVSPFPFGAEKATALSVKGMRVRVWSCCEGLGAWLGAGLAKISKGDR